MSKRNKRSVQDAGQVQGPCPINRAMRRRPARLQAAHEDSCCQDPTAIFQKPVSRLGALTSSLGSPDATATEPAMGQPASTQQHAQHDLNSHGQHASESSQQQTEQDLASTQQHAQHDTDSTQQHTQHDSDSIQQHSQHKLDLTPQHAQHDLGSAQQCAQHDLDSTQPQQLRPVQNTSPHAEAVSLVGRLELHQPQHEQPGRSSIAAAAKPSQDLAVPGKKRKRGQTDAYAQKVELKKRGSGEDSAADRHQCRKLETHLWHAKRMKMVHRYSLPVLICLKQAGLMLVIAGFVAFYCIFPPSFTGCRFN